MRGEERVGKLTNRFVGNPDQQQTIGIAFADATHRTLGVSEFIDNELYSVFEVNYSSEMTEHSTHTRIRMYLYNSLSKKLLHQQEKITKRKGCAALSRSAALLRQKPRKVKRKSSLEEATLMHCDQATSAKRISRWILVDWLKRKME